MARRVVGQATVTFISTQKGVSAHGCLADDHGVRGAPALAQEAPGSNPGAPTKTSRVFSSAY
jgi:hypothetical protein